MFRVMRMRLGGILRAAADLVLPDYWVCAVCGDVKWCEEEVKCWSCGIGEMVYRGELCAAPQAAHEEGRGP